jgi:hypothetical protein
VKHLLRCTARLAYLVCLVPVASYAHAFGTPYVLPLPLWLYIYGCAATLIVTFALFGAFAGTSGPNSVECSLEVKAGRRARAGARWARWALRMGSAVCLLLTILAGFIGTQISQSNIGMTLFWAIFLLGFAYLTLFIGDLYAFCNPWKWCIEGLERLGADFSTPRIPYSKRLAYWPAFLCYAAIIWIELFEAPRPIELSIVLLIYSAVTFAGTALVGKRLWFDQADFLSVYFSLIGKLAPVEYRSSHDQTSWQVTLRRPFVGATKAGPRHISLVLFVLFMLSSTTYDGIHDTVLWTALFWRSLLSLLQPLWGTDLGKAQQILMGSYLVYRQAGLLLFPFLYLGFYVLALLCARALAKSMPPLGPLVKDFCYSLLPIAVAYNFSHYFTFLIFQCRALPALVNDPFGFGWNVLKAHHNAVASVLPMGIVWHTQVAVLLAGHIAGVFMAHRIAGRVFVERRLVVVSQLPLLSLMVIYTILGLWILSLPLGSAVG